jgi:MFS family permease
VVVFAVYYCFGSLDRQLFPLLASPIQTDLGLSDVQLGLLQGAAFSLFFVLASLPVGWLIDTRSRSLTVFCGAIVWSLSAAGVGFATDFSAVFVARAMLGAAEVTIQPAAFSFIAGLFPAGRLAFPLSIFVIGANVGSGLSLIVGGYLASLNYNELLHSIAPGGGFVAWRMTFLVTGLAGLPLAFIIFLVPQQRTRAQASSRGSFAQLWQLYRTHRRFFLAHHFGFMMCLAYITAMLAWNPTFIARTYGWAPAKIGLWLGITQIATALIGLSVHGWIVDRMYRVGVRDAHLKYFMVLCPVAGLLTAGAYAAGQAWSMILLFNLGYFCVVAYPGVGAAALQIATPPELRGRASSVYLIILNLFGASLGPYLVAAITQYVFGRQSMIGVSMSISAVIFMFAATVCLAFGLIASGKIGPVRPG